MKTLLHRLRNARNPHNETRIHLGKLARQYGFQIGAYSYGRPKVRFPESGRHLEIGRYCSIADKVEILLGGGHHVDWVSTYPFAAMRGLWPGVERSDAYHASRGDVTIGNDVWLGSGCVILSGVHVGHGAVIGARAVVTRDVPPYAIVGGLPAKLIRYRFDAETVAALLDIAWWDMEPGLVRSIIPLLQTKLTPDLLDELRSVKQHGSRPDT